MTIEHDCEAFIIGPCLVCGAPQCCAICCQENSLNMARSDIERLTTENERLNRLIDSRDKRIRHLRKILREERIAFDGYASDMFLDRDANEKGRAIRY